MITGSSDSRRTWWLLLALASAALVVPLLVVDMPPITDYPNHLARGFILAFGADDPVLSRIYVAHWAIIPNLASDLILPWAMHLMPVHVAGRMVLALALLLPFLGAVAYSRCAFGERSCWPLAGGLISFNALFLMGFVNFQISLGGALFAAAGIVALGDRRPISRALFAAAASAVVFFLHISGVIFLLCLVAGSEVAALAGRLRTGQPTLRPALASTIVMASILLPCALLYLGSEFSSAGGTVHFSSWGEKLTWLEAPLLEYAWGPDRALAAAAGACLLTLFVLRRYQAASGAMISMCFLVALFLASPGGAKDGGFIDTRFAIMIGLLVFAGFRPARLPAWAGTGLAMAIAVAFCVRTAYITVLWDHHNADLAALRSVLSDVPPGSRVLPVQVTRQDAPAYWRRASNELFIPGFLPTDSHVAALAVIEHRSFWPDLFDFPGQQPVRILPPYDAIACPHRVPADVRWLDHPPADLTDYPCMVDWQHHYDFVLLLHAGGRPDLASLLPQTLHLLASNDYAALFAVR